MKGVYGVALGLKVTCSLVTTVYQLIKATVFDLLKSPSRRKILFVKKRTFSSAVKRITEIFAVWFRFIHLASVSYQIFALLSQKLLVSVSSEHINKGKQEQ